VPWIAFWMRTAHVSAHEHRRGRSGVREGADASTLREWHAVRLRTLGHAKQDSTKQNHLQVAGHRLECRHGVRVVTDLRTGRSRNVPQLRPGGPAVDKITGFQSIRS
jgi:hypothetical protein